MHNLKSRICSFYSKVGEATTMKLLQKGSKKKQEQYENLPELERVRP
jgi:hypothetical protein